MPTYTVKSPDGRTLNITGPTPPSEAILKAMFAQLPPPDETPTAQGPASPAAAAPSGPTASDAALGAAVPFLPPDVSRGVAKGVGRSVVGLAELAHKVPGVSTAMDAVGLNDDRFTQADAALASTNMQQRIGGGIETAAELAVPVSLAADALPSAARAGQTFQRVMAAAKNVPLDLSQAGDAALRVQQLAERGATMPQAVRKFLLRVTDPEKAPMTYEEGRDFASNISRLSANEYQRLTPAIAKEVANLRVTLNAANAKAAQAAGKFAEYRAAMNEYGKAKQLQSAIDLAVTGAKKALPVAGIGAGAYWLTDKIKNLLSE